ncbi:MAG: hypothetical protein ACHQF2_00125 [Flavobacteriales bacterium]
MKNLERLFYLIVFAGFCCKPFHLPGHTLVILFGLLCLFIFYLYALITSERSIAYVLTGMSAVFIMASMLCHLKFFPFASYVMDFSVFILLLAIAYSIRKKSYFRYLSSFVIALVGLHTFILFQPKNKIYHFLNIQFNIHIESDYITWDKYSWFLFIEEKYDEALAANKRAFEIVQKTEDVEFLERIAEHGKLIEEKKWKKFDRE